MASLKYERLFKVAVVMGRYYGEREVLLCLVLGLPFDWGFDFAAPGHLQDRLCQRIPA